MNDHLQAAITMLNRACHRGIKSWHFDPEALRVGPAAWSGLTPEPPPAFTVFEALAVAEVLARITAVRKSVARDE
jgi:hypothetical protein